MAAFPTAILFDLDNTLTHRGRSLTQYAIRFYHDFQSDLRETTPEAIECVIHQVDNGGYSSKQDIFSHLLTALPWRHPATLASIDDHWFSIFPRAATPMDGLYTTLDALQNRGLTLGMITNGRVRTQSTKIEVLKLEPYMTAIVISEALQVKKPDSRIFRHALTTMGTQAHETWFVGDNPFNDVLGAAMCGLTPVWMQGSHEWPTDQAMPDMQIQSLQELLPLLDTSYTAG